MDLGDVVGFSIVMVFGRRATFLAVAGLFGVVFVVFRADRLAIGSGRAVAGGADA